METKTYHIPTINCMHCVHSIKTELSELEGVKSVEGDFQTKKVVVKFENPATDQKIIDLLTEINYAPQ